MMDCQDIQLAILEAGDAALTAALEQHVASCAECRGFRSACAAAVGSVSEDTPSPQVDAGVLAACHGVLSPPVAGAGGADNALPFPSRGWFEGDGLWRRLAVAASLVLLGTLAGLVSLRMRSEAVQIRLAAVDTPQPTSKSAWFDEDLDLDLLSLEAEFLLAEANSGDLVASDGQDAAGTARSEQMDTDVDSLDRELLEVEVDFLLNTEAL